METNSGKIQEFEELLTRYNRAFCDRDLAALRALDVPDDEVPYFDNHADCDSGDLETHLQKVATFFETGDIVPMLVENVRAFVHGGAACVVATFRYSAEPVPGVRASFFLKRHGPAWRIRHVHFSRDPNEASA
ncbi:MAG: nuclear transport factor 2 family protein [Boseongicola sp. SB0677_bin_26]|nr:nuclear transport factor 2 family protein [Boseongicola sp. SB0677_bin_26]